MKQTDKTDKHKKTATKERPGQALILIDVINDFDFPRAKQLLRYALPASRKIATLKGRAKRSRVPVIYASRRIDPAEPSSNFSSPTKMTTLFLSRCTRPSSRQHSRFFSSASRFTVSCSPDSLLTSASCIRPTTPI